MFEAATDTELTFCNLCNKINGAGGKPIKVQKKNVVAEKWLLQHPDYVLNVIIRRKAYDQNRTDTGSHPV